MIRPAKKDEEVINDADVLRKYNFILYLIIGLTCFKLREYVR